MLKFIKLYIKICAFCCLYNKKRKPLPPSPFSLSPSVPGKCAADVTAL